MKNRQQVAGVVAMLALAGLNGAAQTVTFSGQDFNDSDWTAEIIVNEAGSSAKFEARQDPNRGNPGAFRRIKHEGETRSTRVEIHVAHLRGDAVYNPSESGRITSIDHSYDLKNLESLPVFDSTYYLLIFQNNTYYRSPRDRISRLDWTPFGRSGLEARDFTRVAGNGPRRPNFSDKVPPLQFGFASVSNFPASGGEVSPRLGGGMMTAATAASTTGSSASSRSSSRPAKSFPSHRQRSTSGPFSLAPNRLCKHFGL